MMAHSVEERFAHIEGGAFEDERIDSMLVRDVNELVLDLIDCAPFRRPVLTDHRVVGISVGDTPGFTVEGGREEQRLTFRRTRADDPVDGIATPGDAKRLAENCSAINRLCLATLPGVHPVLAV